MLRALFPIPQTKRLINKKTLCMFIHVYREGIFDLPRVAWLKEQPNEYTVHLQTSRDRNSVCNESSAELLSEGRKFTVVAGCTRQYDCVYYTPTSPFPFLTLQWCLIQSQLLIPMQGIQYLPCRNLTRSHWCLHLVEP